jgi:hypothetical protein
MRTLRYNRNSRDPIYSLVSHIITEDDIPYPYLPANLRLQRTFLEAISRGPDEVSPLREDREQG